MKNMKSKILLILSIVIFGTVGVFRNLIPLPSGFVSFSRGALGALFLLCVIILKKQKGNRESIKKNFFKLALSGAFMGLNWVALFESIKYCGVATATVCYYMAPIILILVSPFLFKEKLTLKKILCIIAAFLGIVFVSDFGNFSLSGKGFGVVLGLVAAVLYASIIIINKNITDMDPFDKTVIQLSFAAAIALVYSLLAENITASAFTPKVIILLAVLGLVHTGIAYAMYFSSLEKIPAQTVGVLSYIDPVVAVLLSAALGETLGILGIIGSVLIIGAAVVAAIE